MAEVDERVSRFDPWALWHRLTRRHWPFWYRTGYDFLTWRYECSICRPVEGADHAD